MIWIVFTAMVALAVGGLLRPLLRPAPAAAARVDYDLAVYRDQLEEIARDVDRGLLSDDQATASRTEIQRRMLAAAETDKTAAPADQRAGKRAAMAIVLMLPLAALGFYLMLGAPELRDRPYSDRAAQIAEMKDRSSQIQAMVTRLAERLKADPNDGKGWAMLGRSYRAMGRIEEAMEAYDKAVKLLPGDIPVRLDYAALLLEESEGPSLPEAAMKLLRDIGAIDPDQPDSLYYLGLDAAAKGDKATARKLWTRLMTVIPADSPGRAQVQQQLDSLK
ncbi:c-type cytochrome biogenesis protein CcmI [Paramagnetospirillum kuznetsovii]|uniref:C-type cytochrome biogenesis protein CcmI n=1 Tax=Paramagnetospirillum kuznetsovii TaxID=2053833 RepID=A0A364P1K2_9PROT|nr:c-type cytochrome biogenesis protein CcmI [Paramagnetospirillum kuznetsovii]RAU22995.1 c-type cytochrome biogenesis protein CcmI [Paramagnetospirillum kuznetsovii]